MPGGIITPANAADALAIAWSRFAYLLARKGCQLETLRQHCAVGLLIEYTRDGQRLKVDLDGPEDFSAWYQQLRAVPR